MVRKSERGMLLVISANSVLDAQESQSGFSAPCELRRPALPKTPKQEERSSEMKTNDSSVCNALGHCS